MNDEPRPDDSMPSGMPFDFYKEFLGVDIAKMEQVGEVIGKMIASVMKGMTSSGLSEEQSLVIIQLASKVMFETIINEGRKQ